LQAACSSNAVMLYRVSRREALRRLFASSKDGLSAHSRIVKARWCTGYPGIVFGLDSLSRWPRPFQLYLCFTCTLFVCVTYQLCHCRLQRTYVGPLRWNLHAYNVRTISRKDNYGHVIDVIAKKPKHLLGQWSIWIHFIVLHNIMK